jgi:hypothetical protein
VVLRSSLSARVFIRFSFDLDEIRRTSIYGGDGIPRKVQWGVRYFTPYREVWGTVRSYCTGIAWSITVDGK